MKKFLTVTCAALACTSLALGAAACSDEKKPAEETPVAAPTKVADLGTMAALYTKYEDTSETIAKMETLAGIPEGYYFDYDSWYDSYGWEEAYGNGNFLRLKKQDAYGEVTNYAIYNAETGTVLNFDCSTTYDRTNPDAPVAKATRTWYFESAQGMMGQASLLAGNMLVATLEYEDLENSENNMKKTTVYKADGTVLQEIVETADVYYTGTRVIYADDTFTVTVSTNAESKEYYFDKDFVALTAAPDPLADLFNPDKSALLYNYEYIVVGAEDEFGKSEVGYLCMDEDDYKFLSYDKDMNLKYSYELPKDVEPNALIVFDSGNYLLQYSTLVTDEEAEYDYLDYGYVDAYYSANGITYEQYELCKYELTTVLVNVTTGTVSELECNFVLDAYSAMTPAKNTTYALPAGVDAFFYGIGEIGEDKKVDFDTYEDTIFGITEAGVLTKEADLIAGVKVEYAQEMADGNLMVQDDMGRVYVASKAGAVIKEVNVSVMNANASYGNEAWTLIGDSLYNNSLTKVYTIAENFEIETWMDSAVVIKETIEVAPVAPATDPTYEYKWYLLKAGDTAPTVIADTTLNQQAYYMDGIGYCVVAMSGTAADKTVTYSCAYYNADGIQSDINNQVIIDADSQVYEAWGEDGVTALYFVYNTRDSEGNVATTSIVKLSY